MFRWSSRNVVRPCNQDAAAVWSRWVDTIDLCSWFIDATYPRLCLCSLLNQASKCRTWLSPVISVTLNADLITRLSPHHFSPLASVPLIRENFLLSFKNLNGSSNVARFLYTGSRGCRVPY
ncbi:hypothetical protein J6590_085488 [Homalodisca vitripennis]|nr:hypothetical protein J6590_085488 [Homalodisca vitripennis]